VYHIVFPVLKSKVQSGVYKDFLKTHLRPEIGSFDVTSQDVPQSLKETRGSAGFPGSQEGSRPGSHPARQRPLLTRQEMTPDSKRPLPVKKGGGVQRKEEKRVASTEGRGLEN